VARATPSDEPFVVAIVFRAPFEKNPLDGRGGNLKLQLPRFGGEAKPGYPAVPVQQLRTAVWIPKDFTLFGTPKDFTPEQPTRIDLVAGAVGYSLSTAPLEAWFADSSGAGGTGFAFTTAGRAYAYGRLGAADAIEVAYWRTNFITWVISGTVAAIAILLAYTSWENRLSVLLLVSFGCAMYALRDADQTLNGIAAARWGIAVMVGYWLIHALNRPREKLAPAVDTPANPGMAVSSMAAVIPPPAPAGPAPESPPAEPPAQPGAPPGGGGPT
jgi:hypothetical protein